MIKPRALLTDEKVTILISRQIGTWGSANRRPTTDKDSFITLSVMRQIFDQSGYFFNTFPFNFGKQFIRDVTNRLGGI